MPAPKKRNPELSPQYLLDRLDFQLYTAYAIVKRLKTSLEPDSADFNFNIPAEMHELQRRMKTVDWRLRQLASLPRKAWKRQGGRHHSI
jgi:hypothetical protein